MEPLALDSRMLLQIGAIIVSLAGAFAVAKAQIKNILERQQEDTQELASLNVRLDKVEANDAVFQSKITILSEINSVSALEQKNRERGAIKSKLIMLEKEVERLRELHNGNHK